MKKISQFFWWCAGANIDILKKCPTDQPKYFGVGGTIVFTALMASFAGGYAFFTAFKSTPLSIFFGIFWGLLIFNLDRYIVSTIKDDKTAKITKDEWRMAAPRILMAILLGFVISTPLELKIFQNEIKTEIEILKQEGGGALIDTTLQNQLNDVQSKIAIINPKIDKYMYDKTLLSENAGKFFEERIKGLKNDLRAKNKELSSRQRQVDIAYSSYIKAIKDSLSSNVISHRKSLLNTQIGFRNKIRVEKNKIEKEISDLQKNKGEAILNEKNKIDAKLADLDNRLQEYRVREKGLLDDIRKNKELATQKAENYNGFGAHLQAMGRLTSDPEKTEIFWAKWLITLLFIFIEVAPVIFKLMTEGGPYDDIIERIKYESKVTEQQRISDINDEINTSVKISTDKNKLRLDAELQSNKVLLEKIAKVQAELAEKAVEKWRLEELEKIEKGTSNIINPNNKS